MGKIIAVIGIDGSGKSTFINKLGIPSKHFHDSTSSKSKLTTKVVKYKVSNLKILIGTLLKIYFPNLVIYVRYKYFNKKVFVFDRYSYDFYGRLHSKDGWHAKVLNFLFFKFPKPDYVIFLDIDPALAFQRKKEHDLPFLKMKQKLLKLATFELSKKRLFLVNPINPLKLKTMPTIIRDIIKKGL